MLIIIIIIIIIIITIITIPFFPSKAQEQELNNGDQERCSFLEPANRIMETISTHPGDYSQRDIETLKRRAGFGESCGKREGLRIRTRPGCRK